MRDARFVLALLLMTVAAAASAQPIDPLSPLALSVACAPPPSSDGPPPAALRVIGSQDSVPRTLLGNRDLLIVGGGTNAGVELGQQFFLRRAISFGGSTAPSGSKTVGWIHVVAVNESTAIAAVDHACNGILVSDYLTPYVAPVVSAEIERDETSGQPDFNLLGHILAGNEGREVVGPGDLVLIDWGVDKGMTPGARFAIYRDVVGIGGPIKGLPLASIGEGVVISIGSHMALTRVTRARDAIYSGDYIALRR